MRQPSPRRSSGIVIGLVVAGAGVAGVLYAAHNISSTNGPAPDQKTVKVIVAARDILPGTPITQDDVAASDVINPPVSAVTDPVAAVGLFAVIRIPAHAVLTPDLLAAAAGTTTAFGPITNLKDNFVAVAVPDEAVVGTGGYLAVGSHFDMIADFAPPGNPVYAVKDIIVLRTGSVGHPPAGVPDLLVVEVSRPDALVIAHIIEKGSGVLNISYALRPPSQYGKPLTP